MQTPVALIIFNRPDCTSRVLEVLSKVRPSHLLVIADGPRADHPEDIDRCRATRELFRSIDWECRVETNFSDQNLGCKRRPETGIDWVFERVEEAIILEDDCLPDESFFPYCAEMLARYRHDQRVMMISGYSFLDLPEAARQSYFFSYLGSTWGWATWRRAWALNDPLMVRLPQVIEARLIEHLFPDPVHSRFWYDVLARISDGRLKDAWDYQWQLTCWYNSGYRIFPGVNMISNIGYGEDATHTFGANPYENIARSIEFPLRHPELMIRSYEADREIVESFCRTEGYRTAPVRRSLSRRAFSRLRREIESVVRRKA